MAHDASLMRPTRWAMIRACCNSVANMAVYQLQDVLGLGLEHRMNTPGTVGDHNWTWRFEWGMVDGEDAGAWTDYRGEWVRSIRVGEAFIWCCLGAPAFDSWNDWTKSR